MALYYIYCFTFGLKMVLKGRNMPLSRIQMVVKWTGLAQSI